MVNNRSRQVEVEEDIEEALSSSEDDVPKLAPVTKVRNLYHSDLCTYCSLIVKKVQRMAAKLAVEVCIFHP